MEKQKEFHFTDKDFNLIRKQIYEKTGINLTPAKRDMVYSRLVRRLRQLGMTKFSDYTNLLDDGDDKELVQFINAITTNLTSFFREPHHFTYLAKTIFPHLIRTKINSRKIRIWSAGCSTGEEPYSIAMTVLQHFPGVRQWDIKILATDLDSNVLEKAKSGVYHQDRIRDLDASLVKKWFIRGTNGNEQNVKIKQEAQDLITFNRLNLMEGWPIKGKFDVVFCRNVVIYFDKQTQKLLFERFAEHIENDGHIFLGHSETMFKVSDRFELIGQTMYKLKK